MTPMLRWLIWAALLVGGLSLVLGWQDESAALRPERDRLEQLRKREDSAMRGIQWGDVAVKAHAAQLAWLDRLPEVSQTGVFRAEAMEAMADLCNRFEAGCQVAALGENVENSLPAASSAGVRNTGKNQQTQSLPGLVSTNVRLTVGLGGNKLMALLGEIENGSVLRKVEKLSVRGGRADFVVKCFGIDANAALAVRQNILTSAKPQQSRSAADKAGQS